MLIAPGDELVQWIGLYRERHWALHGHVGPFLVAYAGWAYAWLWAWNAESDLDHDPKPDLDPDDGESRPSSVSAFGPDLPMEAGMLILAGIGILQVLMCLTCYWSVDCLTFLTCARVRNLNLARA